MARIDLEGMEMLVVEEVVDHRIVLPLSLFSLVVEEVVLVVVSRSALERHMRLDVVEHMVMMESTESPALVLGLR